MLFASESPYRVPAAVVGPRLEDILAIGRQHVSPAGLTAFEEAIREKYR
ncbi:hypothetical protein HY772_04720 [Candidatus Woesearchaeota archaeon]|nr:hypothetical protein [Candidatus Woesearchaeota archaeon]